MSTHIHTLFRQAVERYPDHLAIDAGDRTVTYARLEERANMLANFLVESGTPPGSLVVILATDRITVITAIIAILKTGCVFVPLDPDTPRRRLETIFTEIMPIWVITEAQFLQTLGEISPMLPPFTTLCTQMVSERPTSLTYADSYLSYTNTALCEVPMDPDAMCYLYFTSGSTGRPKGIAGRLKGIDHFIQWEIDLFSLGEGTRISQLTTPSFDAFLRDVFTPLCVGGTICVPPSRDTLLDAKKLVTWLDSQRIELLHTVPSVFRTIVHEPLHPDLFPRLRYIAMAGEPLLPSDVKRWIAVFGERVQLVNFYGPSETTMIKFAHFVGAADQDRRSIPIGKPMEGAKGMIVDATGKPCPTGTIGEIYIRTHYCSLGYYKQPELTAQVFFKNPYNDDPNDLIYKTGDFGRVLEDGTFELLGRRDHQVKIRGVRVELGEIENLLLSHPLLRDVAVIDREDSVGNRYLCAYVVLEQPVDNQSLREFVAAALPMAMVPSVFVPMESLPRTITGKTDRKALPAPEQVRNQSEHGLALARTPVEAVLVSLWSNALGVARIGIHDNFFELGGHSLLATQLLARFFDAFQVEIPLQRLLTKPTIADLAAVVEEALLHNRGLRVPPLERVSRDQPLPLSFAQQRLWTLDQLFPDNSANAMPNVIALNGALDPTILAHSINTIVERHESLRTTFVIDADQPHQVIAPTLKIPLPQIDLRNLPISEREREVQRLATEEAQRSFDLARGPLIRTLLVQLDEHDYHLFLTMHHIISDGWSVGVFMRELQTLYEAFKRDKPISLPELPIQYADFAVWLRQWMQGDLLNSQLAYWQRQLANAPLLHELPTDRQRPTSQSFQGAHLSFELPPDLTTALRQLSQREAATLFMTLLAAFATLLNRYSNQTDIIIGSPMVNRHRTELEGLIGFFADILVLRSDLSGNPTFHDLLTQVRTRTLEAYDHRHIPFEKLVDCAGHRRNPAYNPLVQIMFSFEDGQVDEWEAAGVHFKPVGFESGIAKFDLFLAIVANGDRLSGTIEYSTDIFDTATITRFIDHFTTLLQGIVTDPQTPIARLPIMSDTERVQALTGTATKATLPADLRKRLERLIEGQKGGVA